MSKKLLLSFGNMVAVKAPIAIPLSLDKKDKNTYVTPKEPKKIKQISKHQLHKAKQCSPECVYCKLEKRKRERY